MAIVVTVKQKFQVLAWVVGGVVLAGMAISLAANQFLVTANNRIYNDSTKGIEKVSKVQRLLSESRTQETLAVSYAAVVNLEKLAELEQAMASNRSGIGTLINELAISDDEQAALRDLAARYFASTEKTFSFAKSYVTDEASKNITEQSKTHFEKMDSALKELMDANVAAAQEQNGKASSYAAFSRALIFAALAVTAGLIVFLRAFSRSIVNPIGRMEEVVKRIAAGDLTRLVDVSSRDEIGEMGKALNEMTVYLRTMAKQAEEIAGGSLKDEVVLKSENDVLGKAFNKMIEGLRALIAEIRTGSERLANAATNIALSADQTSKNSETSASAVEEMTATMHEMSANMQNVTTTTQRQASSVAETSASIEQMMASIQSVAEYVRRLIGITQNSRTAVSGGAEAVDKAAVGMNEINGAIRRSEQIINSLGEKTDDMSRIVEVIDEISEQTNLLALNAAIEAARAGEQGMGFAVVADEVRKLAERSAQSTREIAELIQSVARESKNAVEHMNKSSALVQRGLSFSGEVIASLDGIRTAVEELSKYSQEIGMATEEQSKGSEQIRKAVSMLNDAIHQISSASEQQSVGAEQVVKAIERVKDMVQQGSSNAVELAGSAEQLNHQAMVLHTMVERFVLSENGGRPGSSEVVRAA